MTPKRRGFPLQFNQSTPDYTKICCKWMLKVPKPRVDMCVVSVCLCGLENATLWEYHLNNTTQWWPLFRWHCGVKIYVVGVL